MRVEFEHRIEAVLDVEALIRAFPQEWEEFVASSPEAVNDEDRLDFAKESAANMGADFFDDEWCSEIEEDDEIHVWPSAPAHRPFASGAA